MRILFAFEAGPAIGLGHALRCRVLAHELVDRGHHVAVVCRGPAQIFSDWDWRVGRTDAIELSRSAAEAAELIVERIRRDRPEWLVCDGYGWWDTVLAERVDETCLLAFDDAGEAPANADLILNQNKTAPVTPADRPNHLTGPRFAVIDGAYRAMRRAEALDSDVQRILISFGGMDPFGHTGRALALLDECLDRTIDLDIVIGPFFSEAGSLRSSHHRVVLHRASRDLAALMKRADLIMTAAGTTCWQACCVGLPLAAVQIAANQSEVVETLTSSGAGYVLTKDEFESDNAMDCIRTLVDGHGSRELRKNLSMAALALVDGLGVKRVVDAMERGIPLQ